MLSLRQTAGPLPANTESGTGTLTGLSEKIYKFRTAQLHIQKPDNNQNTSAEAERTSRTERNSRRACFASFRPEASLTLEAALCLPVVIVFFCSLIWMLRILSAQQDAQLVLEKAAEYVCAAEYLSRDLSELTEGSGSSSAGEGTVPESGEQGKKEQGKKEQKEKEKQGQSLISKAGAFASAASILASYDQEVLGIPVITELKTPNAKDDMTELSVSSAVNIPFTQFSLLAVKTTACRRAWVGREGGAGRAYAEKSEDEKGGEAEADDEDVPVYVAANSANSGRYHVSQSCHYISNVLKAVPAESVTQLRNENGGKYHACPSCSPGSTGTVYIFKSGDAYHASQACKAIGSYVTEMKKSEAERKGLTPCSYCGGKH